jgi:hypothetical protein
MNRANLKVFLAGIVCASGLCATVVGAHHSFATYDQTKTQTLKGTVKAFQWTNPHTVIWIMVQPEGGGAPQEWTIETTSPGVLTRSGWTRKSLNPGDRVSVEFHPLRDGSHGGGLEAVTLLDTGQRLQAKFGAAEKPGLQ